MKRRLITVAAVLAGLMSGAIAHASTVDVTLTGGVFGSDPATFMIARDPTPSQSNGIGFGINGVEVYTNGVATSYNLGFESQHASTDPFFAYGRAGFGDFATGPDALFTGSPGTPQFKIGDFVLTDASTGTPLLVDISAVPEPSTWFLMLAGVGGAGLMLRRIKASGRFLKAAL